jgi:hypothetical protein
MIRETLNWTEDAGILGFTLSNDGFNGELIRRVLIVLHCLSLIWANRPRKEVVGVTPTPYAFSLCRKT